MIVVSLTDFGQIVELLNTYYAAALLMEYAAFVKFSYVRNDFHRPLRVRVPILVQPDSISVFLVLPPCYGILHSTNFICQQLDQ